MTANTVVTAQELEQIVDLEFYCQEITGNAYDFVSLNDAKQFAQNLDYYMNVEGMNAEQAEAATKEEMGL